MTTDLLWNRVHDVWRRSKIAIRPGATQVEISAFEDRYGVTLPSDVRDYFIAADGTGDDMDEGLYRFWPLSEMQPVHDVLNSERFTYPDRFAYPDCFSFADHCINCWDYAVRLTDDPTQPAPVFRVTGGDQPREQIASSFREFMDCYADNPNNII
jgi:SMI1 / KNR4 family (SUKH-1)